MTRPDIKDPRHPETLANLHGMIICSNSASHLWPLARGHMPFELIPDAADGTSPLAKTIGAIRPYCEGPLIIAVSSALAPHVEQHIVENALLDADDYQLLIEPYPRGGALTTALAAATVRLANTGALLLCLPATLAFDKDDRWEQTLRRAYQAAVAGRIALVGSSVAPLGSLTDEPALDIATRRHERPQEPPFLGSIRTGAELQGIGGAYEVRGFIARPAPAVAWRAQQNRSLWSTHIFMLRADLVLAELRTAGLEPNDPLTRSVQRIAETARFFVSLGDEHWSSREAGELVKTLPAISFEEAVFETTRLLAAIPTSIPFADLTTLTDYEQPIEPDAKGNRLRGRALVVQTRGSTVLADGDKLVVALGLEDAIVIDTADATLVTTKAALASMPAVADALRAINAPEL
jgi:mannose-1-phosphate guanylyltransferase/mannose-6-phosphate isomerase